ncbi:MAG: hypothetical protein EXS49_02440, partial [Candidatus Pacebacteria bacterium]|nr:hypothetical protein [Candidatus Paceibacterota bacterium]
MKYGNVSLGQVEAVFNKLGGEDGVMRFLRDELEVVEKKLEEFDLTIGYSLVLEQMIELGNYDWKDPAITAKNFPLERRDEKRQVKGILVHYGRDMSTDAVLSDLNAKGLRPAPIDELLALGAKHPDLQRKFPIVALGSSFVYGGGRYYPYLHRYDTDRNL